MIKKYNDDIIFLFFILMVTLVSVAPYFSVPFIGTYVIWFVQVVVIIFLLKNFLNFGLDINYFPVFVYLFFVVIGLVFGANAAEGYWGWKAFFVNGISLLLPAAAFISVDVLKVGCAIAALLKVTIPASMIIFFYITPDAYGFCLPFLAFFVLAYPFLRPWVCILIFSLVGFVVFSDIGARSTAIKNLLPFLLVVLYFVNSYIRIKIINFLRVVFMFLPFILFYLAVSGVFNIFNIGDYVSGYYESSGGSDLSSDTRTALYREAIETSDIYDSWFFGRTPARGVETQIFSSIADLTGLTERTSGEVAIINLFTWLGFVGVFLYFAIFYSATWLSVNRSRNDFSKILGLYVSFRWAYSWVEDTNNFSLSYIFLWVVLGLCFSSGFRSLSNSEVSVWFSGIFNMAMPKIFERKGR